MQTASARLPSVPQGARKLGRASPQPGVKAKRGGFKPAQAVLPPGQTRLQGMPLPCPVPANSASCEVGLRRAPLHKQRSGTCCVVLTPDHFPISSGAGPGELLNQPQPAPLPKGPCGCSRSPARSWAQPRAGHPSPNPAAAPPRCHCTKNTSLKTSPAGFPSGVCIALSFCPFPTTASVLPSLLSASIPWPHPPRHCQWLQLCIHPPDPISPWQQGKGDPCPGDNTLLGESILLGAGEARYPAGRSQKSHSMDKSPRDGDSPQTEGPLCFVPHFWELDLPVPVGAAPAVPRPGRWSSGWLWECSRWRE